MNHIKSIPLKRTGFQIEKNPSTMVIKQSEKIERGYAEAVATDRLKQREWGDLKGTGLFQKKWKH